MPVGASLSQNCNTTTSSNRRDTRTQKQKTTTVDTRNTKITANETKIATNQSNITHLNSAFPQSATPADDLVVPHFEGLIGGTYDLVNANPDLILRLSASNPVTTGRLKVRLYDVEFNAHGTNAQALDPPLDPVVEFDSGLMNITPVRLVVMEGVSYRTNCTRYTQLAANRVHYIDRDDESTAQNGLIQIMVDPPNDDTFHAAIVTLEYYDD